MEQIHTSVPYICLDLTDSDQQSTDVACEGKIDGAGKSWTIGTGEGKRPITPVRSAYRGLDPTVGHDLLYENDDKTRPLSLAEWMNPSFSFPLSSSTLPSLDQSNFNLRTPLHKHAADVFEDASPSFSTVASPNQMPPLISQTSLLPAIDFRRPVLPFRSLSDYTVDKRRIQRANGVPADQLMSINSEYAGTNPAGSNYQSLADAMLTTTTPNALGEERSKEYLSPKIKRIEPLWRSQSSGGVPGCHKTILHQIPGSREVCYKVNYQPENGNCESSVEKDARQQPQTNASIHRSRSHTSPNHLANMIASKDKQGKLSQAHYETIITPPRPKVVMISGCKSSPNTLQPASPLDHPSTLVSVFEPETPTPPVTPGELMLGDAPTFLQRLEACNVKHVECHNELPATPPSTPALSLQESNTTKDATTMQTENSYVKSPAHVPEYTLDWTLYELESSVFGFPRKTLQLSSPVIQHIRTQLQSNPDPNPRRGSTSTSAKTYRSPSFDPPHSRYSILKPLSSHPVSPIIPMGDCPTSPRSHCQPSQSTVYDSLRTIFPKASNLELDTIHATQVALSYVTNVLNPRSSSGSPSRISPKARVTLGLQPLTSHSPSETSWFRSRSSSPAVDELLRERMEFVKDGLRDALKGLLGEMVQEDLRYGGETLLLAVGEVVRLGERS